MSVEMNSPTSVLSVHARSQRKRKRIEECFGWLKTIALLRKVRHRGVSKVHWIFTLTCAAYQNSCSCGLGSNSRGGQVGAARTRYSHGCCSGVCAQIGCASSCRRSSRCTETFRTSGSPCPWPAYRGAPRPATCHSSAATRRTCS